MEDKETAAEEPGNEKIGGQEESRIETGNETTEEPGNETGK